MVEQGQKEGNVSAVTQSKKREVVDGHDYRCESTEKLADMTSTNTVLLKMVDRKKRG